MLALIVGLMAAHAADPVGAEALANGWYLWHTGQDDRARAVSSELHEADPSDLGAAQLYAAVHTSTGAGGYVEAHFRELWGVTPADPGARVSLAWAVSMRHDAEGTWCDEVTSLLSKVEDPAARYWAVQADRQRELRCTGETGHAAAELRRLAGSADLARGDSLVESMRTGYIKTEHAEDLEALLASEPHRVGATGALWADEVSGPGLQQARRHATRALKAALEGSDPSLVHAALVAYRQAGKDKQAQEALGRLATLDPDANPDAERSVDQVVDPPLYGAIDDILRSSSQGRALGELDALEGVPESGALAAHFHAARAAVLDLKKEADAAFAARRSAYQAEPKHRFHAEAFATAAAERAEDAELGLAAIDRVLDGRMEPGEDARAKGILARRLRVRAALLGALERHDDAISALYDALWLDPSSVGHLLVGGAWQRAERPEAAVIHLATGGSGDVDEQTMLDARARLEALTAAPYPAAERILGEAGAKPGSLDGRHAMVGKGFPVAERLPADPEPAEGEEAPEPRASGADVVVLTASWHEASIAALERAASIGERYAERGVRTVAWSVDALEEHAERYPDDVAMEVEHIGPEVMAALGAVALPTVVIVDLDGSIESVLLGWDRGSLALESVLDAMLPDEEE